MNYELIFNARIFKVVNKVKNHQEKGLPAKLCSMSEDKSITDENYSSQIDANKSDEMQYWSKKLSISSDQLTDAIMSTGTTDVQEIRDYLKRMEDK